MVLHESLVKNLEAKFTRNFGRKNPKSKKLFIEHFELVVDPGFFQEKFKTAGLIG